MPTHYCIHGATYNGDGTADNEAASTDAAGAFNDAAACLDGSQTGISDDDTIIYKTERSSANITMSFSADKTIARRKHIFDDGTQWPGEGGTFELSTNSIVYLASYGEIDAKDYRLEITQTGNLQEKVEIREYSIIRGVHTRGRDLSTNAVAFNYRFYTAISGSWGLIENCKYTYRGRATATPDARNFAIDSYSLTNSATLFVRNFTIDFGNIADVGLIKRGGHQSGESVHVDFKGLTIENPSSDCYISGKNIGASPIIIESVRYDNDTWHPQEHLGGDGYGITTILSDIHNLDSLKPYEFGYGKKDSAGELIWIPKQNYPTLTALDFNGDKWSWRWNPSSFMDTAGRTAAVAEVVKLNDQGAGVKTITQEFLLYDVYAAPTNETWYINVIYRDTSGNMHFETTRGSVTPVESAADWDSTGYGGASFDKYKVSLTTANSVADDSLIRIELFCNVIRPNSNAFCFIHPDAALS